jgi:hypothetical protein
VAVMVGESTKGRSKMGMIHGHDRRHGYRSRRLR